MLDVLLYQQEDDRSPFAEWFDAPDRQAAARVTIAVERLRHGNVSHVESVGEGVQDYWLDGGPGYRICLGREGERVVILLPGGAKRRQAADIARAHAYWADYKRRR